MIALPTEVSRLFESCQFKRHYYIHVLQIRMYTLLYCKNEVERNLACKCTVLCYILKYSYIVQIARRRIRPVLAFNMQVPDQVECLVVFAC